MISKGIEFLNKKCQEQRLPYFNMALTHLMDIGWRNASEITEEYLNKMLDDLKAKQGDDIWIMSPDFQVWLCRTAMEIANNCTSTELIQWCEVNKPYDCKGIKKI